MTHRVSCRWCCDSLRVGRRPCIVCRPGPQQQVLIPPPFRFDRPWRKR